MHKQFWVLLMDQNSGPPAAPPSLCWQKKRCWGHKQLPFRCRQVPPLDDVTWERAAAIETLGQQQIPWGKVPRAFSRTSDEILRFLLLTDWRFNLYLLWFCSTLIQHIQTWLKETGVQRCSLTSSISLVNDLILLFPWRTLQLFTLVFLSGNTKEKNKLRRKNVNI